MNVRPELTTVPTPRTVRETDGVRAVLLAGGEGRRLGPLGRGRLKPLVPFDGTARLIDFSLTNARRSSFRDVLLLSQYEKRRLMDDLHAVWNRAPGFRMHFAPYDQAYRRSPGTPPAVLPRRTWPQERGTADALTTKADPVFEGDPSESEILVLHADHVYRFDYGDMIRRHRASGAAHTVSYQRIERRYVHLFFDAAFLRRYLERLRHTDKQHDISRDVIPAMPADGQRVRSYPVESHWEDNGTVDRYHLGLLGRPPILPLTDPPLTVRPELTPRFVEEGDGVRSRIVRDDLVNPGLLDHCVTYPGVRIGTGATVRDSVLLPGARIPDGARLESAIVLGDDTVEHCVPEPATIRTAS
ncbi:sugar phosphate nucleotidyltransferase [Streptomyces sp. NPDC048106]|uniref:sugar phosphate nucleotidyltransferase n=1 Tax=Streptomyces sp. NPDC048106 TaxID=3155750 RepID=UPI0034568625